MLMRKIRKEYDNNVKKQPLSWVARSLPFRYLLHKGVGEGAIPFPWLLHFTLDPYLILRSVKQGAIKYHFLSFLYDSTCDDWTQVSRAIIMTIT